MMGISGKGGDEMGENLLDLEGKKTARPRGTDSAKVIQVIVTKSLLGCGSKEDPARPVFQYWDMDGTLLAVRDAPCESCPSFRQGK